MVTVSLNSDCSRPLGLAAGRISSLSWWSSIAGRNPNYLHSLDPDAIVFGFLCDLPVCCQLTSHDRHFASGADALEIGYSKITTPAKSPAVILDLTLYAQGRQIGQRRLISEQPARYHNAAYEQMDSYVRNSSICILAFILTLGQPTLNGRR
jgi:hypothetical protein